MERPPAGGIKIAAFPGDEIDLCLVKRYNLEERDSRVVQKMREPVENKMVQDPGNKGGGLTIKTKQSTRSSVKKNKNK